MWHRSLRAQIALRRRHGRCVTQGVKAQEAKDFAAEEARAASTAQQRELAAQQVRRSPRAWPHTIDAA